MTAVAAPVRRCTACRSHRVMHLSYHSRREARQQKKRRGRCREGLSGGRLSRGAVVIKTMGGIPCEVGYTSCPHTSAVHLSQCGLCLREPEGHPHSAVHVDSRGQRHARLIQPLYLAVQRTKTAVAVGLERAHTQLLGECKGLPVIGFSLWGLRRRVLGCDLTKEPQGVSFVALCLMPPGELQGMLCLGIRFVQPAGQQIHFTQPDRPERLVEHEMHRDGLCDRLL